MIAPATKWAAGHGPRTSHQGADYERHHHATTLIPAGTWNVDPTHSKAGFAVKHMGIATVRGEFTAFQGALEIADDLASAKTRGTVKPVGRHQRTPA